MTFFIFLVKYYITLANNTKRLDIWHGLERIRGPLPSTHKSFSAACHDLRGIFYSDNTLHEYNSTVNSKIISTRLNDWRKKYKKGENPIITDKVEEAIDNLMKHIEKGCLSDIKARMGSVINELTHKHLNAALTEIYSIDCLLMEMFLTNFMFSYSNGQLECIDFKQYLLKVKLGEIDESVIPQRPSIWQKAPKTNPNIITSMRIPKIKEDKTDREQHIKDMSVKCGNYFDIYRNVKSHIDGMIFTLQ